jgi:malic enzyme
MADERRKITEEDALQFHAQGRPGKLEVVATKPLTTQRDLSLAYSPGVATPCLRIQKDPLCAYDYTAKGNMVAVISNGTAVLGLGNIGALASTASISRSRPRMSTSSSTACACSAPASAASIWRTSRRRNVSSSNSACARR